MIEAWEIASGRLNSSRHCHGDRCCQWATEYRWAFYDSLETGTVSRQSTIRIRFKHRIKRTGEPTSFDKIRVATWKRTGCLKETESKLFSAMNQRPSIAASRKAISFYTTLSLLVSKNYNSLLGGCKPCTGTVKGVVSGIHKTSRSYWCY